MTLCPPNGGVCGVLGEAVRLNDSVNSHNSPALEMDLAMDLSLTNEFFSCPSPSSLFNNDDTDLIGKAWNIAESKAIDNKSCEDKSVLETPDVFRDLGPDLGFDSWQSADLGITLDDPFFDTFVNLDDGSSLDLFPDVLSLSDGCCVGTEMVDVEPPCHSADNGALPKIATVMHATDTMSQEASVKVVSETEPSAACTVTNITNQVEGHSVLAEVEVENLSCEVETVNDSTMMDNSQFMYSLQTLDESTTSAVSKDSSSFLNLEELLSLDDLKFENVISFQNFDEITNLHTADLSCQTSSSTSTEPCSQVEKKSLYTNQTTIGLSNSRKRTVKDNTQGSSDKKVKLIKHEAIPDKQTLRRIKNNIASRHSRASRKNREKELCETADKLELENSELRLKVEELSKQTGMLRKILVEKLSGGGN